MAQEIKESYWPLNPPSSIPDGLYVSPSRVTHFKLNSQSKHNFLAIF